MAVKADVRLLGITEVNKEMTRAIKKITNRTESGMTKAGIFLKAESMKEAPVATGNLRASAYMVSSSGKIDSKGRFEGDPKMESQHSRVLSNARLETAHSFEPEVHIGYSAVYALSVHENFRSGKTGGVSPSGKKYTSGYTGSGKRSRRVVFSEVGKWKYLEDPYKTNAKKLIKIIARDAKGAIR